MRSAADHAASAYVASYTITLKHCQTLDPAYEWEGSDINSHIAKSIASYNNAVNEVDRLVIQLTSDTPPRQQSLSLSVDRRDHDEFFAQLSDSDKRAINSELLKGASGCLEAKPCKELNLAWESSEFATQHGTE